MRLFWNCRDKIIKRPFHLSDCRLLWFWPSFCTGRQCSALLWLRLFLPGLLLGPLSIPTCCWNTVYTLSITVPRGPTNSPGSAGSVHRKYTPLINVVATLQGKVFLYLTIKTNHMRIRVLRNTIYLFMFCGSIPWHNLCFLSVWNLN